jgi:DNA modification methylase
MWQHEPCLYGWVEGRMPKLKPPPNQTTVWAIDQKGEQDGIHPTQKPVEIFWRPLQYHTKPGKLCYEPFLGSGTCLIAAEELGRRCHAIELEREPKDPREPRAGGTKGFHNIRKVPNQKGVTEWSTRCSARPAWARS